MKIGWLILTDKNTHDGKSAQWQKWTDWNNEIPRMYGLRCGVNKVKLRGIISITIVLENTAYA